MKSLHQRFLDNPASLSDNEAVNLLEEIRKEVDALDTGIVRLLLKRIEYSLAIGRIKTLLKKPSYTPSREAKILENVLSLAPDELSRRTIRNIYERIIDESRGIQKLRNNDE